MHGRAAPVARLVHAASRPVTAAPSATATCPRCAADSFGADRLVLGTDFPYETGAVFERAVSYITTSGLAPGDADRVLSANAEALFGRRDP
jgi:predicted TIM-barrel fold metal-dependent hydrolase